MHDIRVLLVDDQAIVAAALQQMLCGEEGISFFYCSDTNKLFEHILEVKPSILLQDLLMPNINGIDLIKSLRKRKEFEDLPIILLSATESSEVKYEAFMAGANDYVVKFPEKIELLGRIRTHSKSYQNMKEREKTERLLSQKSRLESLGNLSAGIAHEINTPLQYVLGNLSFFQNALIEIEKHFNSQVELNRDSEIDYLRSELPQAILETIAGVQQIAEIVKAMKAFSHPGTTEKSNIDLKKLITDVITVSKSEWRDLAEVSMLSDDLNLNVLGFSGSLSQVFLNIIVNAAQALETRRLTAGPDKTRLLGKIEISFCKLEKSIEVRIKDNAGGIPKNVQDKIFDPFFTTKSVGKGSGQGLYIARTIVEDTHSGHLSFQVEEGQGTTFIISLPMAQ